MRAKYKRICNVKMKRLLKHLAMKKKKKKREDAIKNCEKKIFLKKLSKLLNG